MRKWERAVTTSETSDFLNLESVCELASLVNTSVSGRDIGVSAGSGQMSHWKKPHNYISVWLRHCADLDYLWTSLNERLEESLWVGHKTNRPDCYIRVDSQIICQPKIREGDCLRLPWHNFLFILQMGYTKYMATIRHSIITGLRSERGGGALTPVMEESFLQHFRAAGGFSDVLMCWRRQMRPCGHEGTWNKSPVVHSTAQNTGTPA